MCGIIGYVGKKTATPILIAGLRCLEYRGYDSAGLALLSSGKITRIRSVGNIQKLEQKIGQKKLNGTTGIAHTRWATHGGVTKENAHPHFGPDKKIALVHNGIIENYQELKTKYLAGHTFTSETDTEVLAHLIELFLLKLPLKKAVEKTLKKVHGTYGLVVFAKDEPHKIITARRGSPIAIGVGDSEYFIASDASPILPYTRKIIYLDDGEMAEITPEGCDLFKIGAGSITKEAEQIEWNAEETSKEGFATFMLKEITEQPRVFLDALRGRVRDKEASARMGGFNMTDEKARQIEKIIFISCGTAHYAAQIGEYLMEKIAQIPARAEIGSEFRYRSPIITKNTLVFAISQSGETIDTLASLKEAKRKGAQVRGIVNVVGSTIAREAGAGTYIHAGPELAVASTKAFINMIAILTLYALYFGRLKKTSAETGEHILKALREIPDKMNRILEDADKIKKLAKKYKKYGNFLFLGRGLNYPVALEGSHKLKEISYIHSEAYPAGEMKHGTNALLSPDFPVLGIATRNGLYEKMLSNLEEVRARKAPLIALATEGDQEITKIADDVIFVPKTLEILEPLLNTIPLQLFAYYLATELKRNVDRPRNLAKSVTVE